MAAVDRIMQVGSRQYASAFTRCSLASYLSLIAIAIQPASVLTNQ